MKCPLCTSEIQEGKSCSMEIITAKPGVGREIVKLSLVCEYCVEDTLRAVKNCIA